MFYARCVFIATACTSLGFSWPVKISKLVKIFENSNFENEDASRSLTEAHVISGGGRESEALAGPTMAAFPKQAGKMATISEKSVKKFFPFENLARTPQKAAATPFPSVPQALSFRGT